MSLLHWWKYWISGPDAGSPAELLQSQFIAVLAGGLAEPASSLSALRTMLYREYQIPSVMGATFNASDWPPYPYQRIKQVGATYYRNTKRCLHKYPNSKVILVGHSLGGLVSLYVASRLRSDGYNDRLHKIFLLGAPLYGAHPQFLFVFVRELPFVREVVESRLRGISHSMAELTEFLLKDFPREDIVTMYCPSDRFVHEEHAIIAGARNIRINHGHLLMVASPEVARQIHDNVQ